MTCAPTTIAADAGGESERDLGGDLRGIESTAAESVSIGDSLAVGMMSSAVLMGLQKSLGLVRHLLFLTWLTQDQMGRFSLAQNFAMTFIPLIQLGIPASLCRYAESFRRQGQLRSYLRRVGWACFLLAAPVSAFGVVCPESLAVLIYRDSEAVPLVRLLAIVFFLVAGANLVHELLLAHRLFRVASSIQMAGTAVFLTSGTLLMLLTSMRDCAVLIAYGLSNATIMLGGLWCFRPYYRGSRDHGMPLSLPLFWKRIIGYSLAHCVSASLSGMYFYVANRSLLCLDGVAPAEAEGLVGQLASGVFIPMQLMQFIGGFSGTTLFPYLSRDWESGRKAEVCRQFYTALKLVTLIYCAAALMVLVASPLLFDGLLRGRYNSGREVLSWALALYAWMNILYFTQIFVWCAERPWRVAWAMVPGVLVQWLAGLWLVPALGLHGTVLALILGHLVTVALLLYFCHGYGLPADRSLLITLLIPFAFLFDSGCTAWLILLAGISLFHTDWILGRAERVVCLDRIRALAARGAALLHRRSTLPTR